MSIADSLARLGAHVLDCVKTAKDGGGEAVALDITMPEGDQLRDDHAAALMLLPALFMALAKESGKSVEYLIAEYVGTIWGEEDTQHGEDRV